MSNALDKKNYIFGVKKRHKNNKYGTKQYICVYEVLLKECIYPYETVFNKYFIMVLKKARNHFFKYKE